MSADFDIPNANGSQGSETSAVARAATGPDHFDCVSVAQGNASEFVGSQFLKLALSRLKDDVVTAELDGESTKVKLNLDDRNLAEHFVDAYALKEWCVQTRYGDKPKWMRFVKGVWEPDQLSVVDDVGSYLARIGDQLLHDPNSNAKTREAEQMGSYRKARRVANYVQTFRRMHVPVERFDSHPWLLGFPGGYLDEENRLREPDPGLFISRSLPFAPVFGQPTPDYDKLLRNVSMSEEELAAAILDIFGCSLSGTGQEQKMPFFRGSDGVGVTTLLECTAACAGAGTARGYAKVISHKAFVKGSAEPFLPADMSGFRMLVVSEIDKREEWAMSTVKQATGSGSMPIEENGEQGRTVPVTWLPIFQGSEIPVAGAIDKAFMQRFLVIPVEGKQIRGTAEDVKQYAKHVFKKEGPAILGKLLEARLRYRKRGSLLIPSAWREATDEYFGVRDVEGHWIADCLEMGLDDNCRISMLDAYKNRREWGAETGHAGNPGALQAWAAKLHQQPLIVEAEKRGQVKFVRSQLPGSRNKQRYMVGARLIDSSGLTLGQTSAVNF